MKLYKPKKLLTQLVIFFTFIVFIPLILIVLISYHSTSKQMRDVTHDLLLNVLNNVNRNLENTVEEYDWFTLNLAVDNNVQTFVNLEADDYSGKWHFDNWFSNKSFMENMIFRLPMLYRLYILSDSGMHYNVITNYSIHNNVMPQHTNDEIFALPQNGSIQVNTYKRHDEINNQIYYTVSFARRILTPLVGKGTIFIDIEASFLNKLWEYEDISQGYITIVDSNGDIIYGPDRNQIGMKANDLFNSDILTHPADELLYWTVGEEEFCSMLQHSSSTGWTLIATLPYQTISNPLITLRNIIVFICVISIPLTFIIIFVFVKNILTPLNRLEQHMKKVEQEHWHKIHGEIPTNEIGHLMHVFNNMVAKIERLINQVYKVELEKNKKQYEKQKAEFQALQMQINPHFLYNTLNTINLYAIISNEDKISHMIESLSDMFRYAVNDTLEPVKLSDEKQHTMDYLLIESHRRELMPVVTWDIDEFLEYPILRLILQPLIENVFKHGFKKGVKEQHYIHVQASQACSTSYTLTVADNGTGFPNNFSDTSVDQLNIQDSSIGLINVYKRLKIAYGSNAEMLISSSSQEGTCIKIIIPMDQSLTLEEGWPKNNYPELW